MAPGGGQVPTEPLSLFLASGVSSSMVSRHTLWGGTTSGVSSSLGHGLFKRCTCSRMGPPQAMVSRSGVPAPLCSTSTPLAFLFPFFIPLFPILLSSLLMCSLLFSVSTVFCPFLSIFSQRHHTSAWWAQLLPLLGLLWSQLELTVPGTGQPLVAPH